MAQKNGVGVDALSAVHEITAKIVASLDLDQTLATIARAMCEVISADIGAIYLIDEPAGLLRLRGISGQRSKHWEGHTMSLDRGMNAIVSTDRNSQELIEKRANAFSAAFLMPQSGVSWFLSLIDKGGASRWQLHQLSAI